MRIHYLGLSLISAIAVIGSSDLPPMQSAIAAVGSPMVVAQQSADQPSLPLLIRNDLRLHVAQENGVPYEAVRVVNATAEIWTDSCFGLGGPAESCLAVRYPGWRVELTDGQQTWIYRSDRTGRILRRESPQNIALILPDATAQQVLARAATDLNLLPPQVEIVAAEPRTWDGCLGIYPSVDTLCTQVAISGWRVIVAAPDQVQVYHANHDGSDIRLNPVLTQRSDNIVAPRFLTGPLPTTFEAPPQATLTIITSGGVTSDGIAGRIYKTVIYSDRSMVGFNIVGNQINSPIDLGSLSPQDYATFVRLLETNQLGTFDGLKYPTPEYAANDVTVTLISGANQITQYSELAIDQLPTNLQRIHQGWFELIN